MKPLLAWYLGRIIPVLLRWFEAVTPPGPSQSPQPDAGWVYHPTCSDLSFALQLAECPETTAIFIVRPAQPPYGAIGGYYRAPLGRA